MYILIKNINVKPTVILTLGIWPHAIKFYLLKKLSFLHTSIGSSGWVGGRGKKHEIFVAAFGSKELHHILSFIIWFPLKFTPKSEIPRRG